MSDSPERQLEQRVITRREQFKNDEYLRNKPLKCVLVIPTDARPGIVDKNTFRLEVPSPEEKYCIEDFYQDYGGVRKLPLAQTLGVPLACVKYRVPGRNDSEVHNKLVSILTFDMDVPKIAEELSASGESKIGLAEVYDTCLLFRYDGEDLLPLHIRTLDCYLDNKMSEIHHLKVIYDDGTLRSFCTLYKKMATPEGFKRFCDLHRAMNVEMERHRGDPTPWMNLANPVDVAAANDDTSIVGVRRFDYTRVAFANFAPASGPTVHHSSDSP